MNKNSGRWLVEAVVGKKRKHAISKCVSQLKWASRWARSVSLTFQGEVAKLESRSSFLKTCGRRSIQCRLKVECRSFFILGWGVHTGSWRCQNKRAAQESGSTGIYWQLTFKDLGDWRIASRWLKFGGPLKLCWRSPPYFWSKEPFDYDFIHGFTGSVSYHSRRSQGATGDPNSPYLAWQLRFADWTN